MLEFYWKDIERMSKEASKYIPIKRNNDVFKNELTLLSEHIWYLHGYMYDDLSIHNNVPIDVLYKSNSSGERVFFVTDTNYEKNGLRLSINKKIILNIDGKKNIKVEYNYYADQNDEKFEIKKEQLYELCMASSLKIQISGREGVLWESEADGFITVLQALYNEAFDNSMFTDANNIIRSDFEKKINEIDSNNKEQQEKKSKRNLGVLLLVGGIIIGLFAIPFMNNAFNVVGIICLALGGIGFVIGLVLYGLQ